jgi:MerR family transcriptional regulator/heat shock protein HspR
MTPEPSAAMSQDQGVYVISVAAELLGIHPQTLRSYERQGLICPARTPGGTRLYSAADVNRARRIVELSNEGLTHNGISRILALEERVAQLTRPSVALVPLRPSRPRRPPRS